jgi:drug/metabolite transporter (DMT)-like permease
MLRWMFVVFLGACSYGVVSTFVKFAYAAGFSPSGVTGSQVLFGALMLWVPALFFSKGPIARKERLRLLAAGSAVGFTSIFYYAALQHLSASIAIVMLFQFTWIGVLLEAVIERRQPGRDKLGALVLLGIGTVLAAGILEGGPQRISLIGVGFGLLAATSYAFVILFSGRVAPHVNPWTRSALMLTGAAVLVLLVYPPTFLFDGSLSRGLLFWGSAAALFAAAIPTILFNFGVPQIGSGLATILSAAELPMAVLMSRFVLGEAVSTLQWLGVLVVLIGIALPELTRRRPKQPGANQAA